jgi:hypothetical protein
MTGELLVSALCSRWLTTRRMGEDAPIRPFARAPRVEQLGGTHPLWTDLREYFEDGAEQGIHVRKLLPQDLRVFDFFDGGEKTLAYFWLALNFTLIPFRFAIPLRPSHRSEFTFTD